MSILLSSEYYNEFIQNIWTRKKFWTKFLGPYGWTRSLDVVSKYFRKTKGTAFHTHQQTKISFKRLSKTARTCAESINLAHSLYVDELRASTLYVDELRASIHSFGKTGDNICKQ